MLKKNNSSLKKNRKGFERLEKSLKKRIVKFFQDKDSSSISFISLCKLLDVPKEHNTIFRSILDSLVFKKIIQLSEKKYLPYQKKDSIVRGILHKHPRGFGFLQPEDISITEQDVFIPKHLSLNAIDGDKVEVEIFSTSKGKGPEGKIINVLQRAHKVLAGIVISARNPQKIELHLPLLGLDRTATLKQPEQKKLSIGDRITVAIVDWGSKETTATATFDSYIGHISDPSKDVLSGLSTFDIRHQFPEDVTQEVQQFASKVTKKDLQGREDFRELNCITIDPDTAKDFDDALSIEQDESGNYHLGVHIADVSHYVQAGTALDKEASLRSNSTYFPGKCIPMLPSELSNQLCSLKPRVLRLTISVIMKFNKKGALVDHHITKSVIRSRKRFTYKEAKQILDGSLKSPFKQQLSDMVELCHLLKKQKAQRGCIDLALPSQVVVVDDAGNPLHIDVEEYDITHQLVEEFMLQANEVVAKSLTKAKKPMTYRIHEEPDEESLKTFALVATSLGFKISDKPKTKELQKVFQEASTTNYSDQLAISFIKCMKLACYSPDNIGHFGLRLEHYCHFTSPIRRYVDLIIHRILFDQHNPATDLKILANTCSEKERVSARAENHVRLLKTLRLLEKYYQKDPYKKYSATITKVVAQGIIFELTDYMVEGFIHVSELADDYFVYDEKKGRLKGRHHQQEYAVRNSIDVTITGIDLIMLKSSWALR